MANKNGENSLADELRAEAVRYFKNGIETIRKAPRMNGIYIDAKFVREGCGILYRGVLSAINAAAITRGITVDKLPGNVNEIRDFLKRRSALNGKVLKAFNIAYRRLHLYGYYGTMMAELERGLIQEGISNAQFIIEKLTGKRIS